MKKILTIALCLISLVANAQLSVKENGKVIVGTYKNSIVVNPTNPSITPFSTTPGGSLYIKCH